jgi:hypothetical protein
LHCIADYGDLLRVDGVYGKLGSVGELCPGGIGCGLAYSGQLSEARNPFNVEMYLTMSGCMIYRRPLVGQGDYEM